MFVSSPCSLSVCRSAFPGQDYYLKYRISGSVAVAFVIRVA